MCGSLRGSWARDLAWARRDSVILAGFGVILDGVVREAAVRVEREKAPETGAVKGCEGALR